MVMKDSYGFDAKNQVRGKLKDFVSKAYPSENQRKNLKVLTLLGHEDHELKQIWDPLGVRRENITSLEYNPKAYEIVNGKNLGVNLVKGDIADYVAETDKKFDVINLDYVGPFDFNKFQTLQEVAYNQMLESKGVLATWYSGRREKGNTLGDLAILNHAGIGATIDAIKLSADSPFADPVKQKDLVEYTEKRLGSFQTSGFRGDVISEQIISAFVTPVLNFDQHPLVNSLGVQEEYDCALMNSEVFKKRNKYFMSILQNKSDLKEDTFLAINKNAFEAFKKSREEILSGKQISEDYKKELLSDLHFFGYQTIHDIVKRKVEGSLGKNKKYFSEPFFNVISNLISHSYVKPYFITDGQKFSYHSDNGTPMFVDFCSLKKENFSNFFNWKINDKKVIIPLSAWLNKKLGRNMEIFQELSAGYTQHKMSDREYIGTQKQIPQKIQETPKTIISESKKLSNEEVYSLIKQGKTNEEIIQIDSSLTSGKIGARRAWITMKNEKPAKIIKENKLEEKVLNVESVVKESQEGLSRDEVVFLLKEGFGTKEILETYPNTFTDYQLRGYKAQITAGRL